MSIKPITDTLRILQGGLFLDACSDQLAEAVKAVDETGKAGRLTITLELKKSGGALAISAKVTSKTPAPKPDEDLLWPTVEGNLSLENPHQRKLALQFPPARSVEVRGVDSRTGEIIAKSA
jgi:hypothetical protein